MIKLLTKWFLFALVIMGTCYLPGIKVDGFEYALLIALVLTFVNVFIKPILKILAFPINIMTLGLFNLVLNMGILYAIAYFIPQYHIGDWLNGLVASMTIAIAYGIIKHI